MRIPRSEQRLRMSLVCLALSSILFASCGLALDSQAKIERGQEAFDNGEYRAAIIDAKAVLQGEPDNLDARLLLGRASVAVGDGAAAEKEFRRALDLGGSRSEVLADLGRALLLQGKFDEVLAEISTDDVDETDRTPILAILAEAHLGLDQPERARELYTEALSHDASSLEAQLGVARTYIAEQNLLQARDTLDHVLSVNEDYVPALQLSGLLGLQRRELQRASSDFERAIELARAGDDAANEITALYGQSDVLFLQENIDGVRPLVERMQEIAADDPRTMITTARLAAADQELTRAQEILQQVLRRAPDFRAAQFLLGMVHKQNGNLGQAEMYLSAFVAAEPENAQARMLLAETRLAMSRHQEARQVLDPLTAGANADIVSLSMAAGANLNLGEIDEAIALLERGVAAEPGNMDLRVQLALTYLRNQQFDDARRVLAELPDMSGEANEFRRDVLLVLTALGQGKQTDALAEARAVRDKWPDRVDAHSLVGSIEMGLGELQDARQSFGRGLEVAPEDIRSLRYLAQLDTMEGELGAARQRYEAILDLEPGDDQAMVSLAQLAARTEQHDEARAWLEKAREANPGSVAARAILASYYLAFRDFGAAADVAAEAVELRPGNAWLQNLLGLAQLSDGKLRDAEFSLGKAVELAPGEADYRLNLARAQAARGNNSSAIITLEGDLDASLEHLQAGLLLASLRADTGDLAGALQTANQLGKRHPDQAMPMALRAELLVRQGDLQAAIESLDKALDIEMIDRFAVRAFELRRQAGASDQVAPLTRYLKERPLDTNVRTYLASAYESLAETGNAIREYELILKQDPDNFVVANNLAWNYFLVADERAEALARRAYELRPDSGAVADTLGWILTNKGNHEEAVSTLRKAVELSDGRNEIRYHLAVALAGSGQNDEARSILEELVTSDEAFADKEAARALLARLGS